MQIEKSLTEYQKSKKVGTQNQEKMQGGKVIKFI